MNYNYILMDFQSLLKHFGLKHENEEKINTHKKKILLKEN